MIQQTLEQKIKACGNPVTMLRSSQAGPYVFPIAAEFSNWRDEQEAWRKTAVLFDQSHHMTDLYVEGPDVVRLLSDLGINSFKAFGRDKAKQLVVCNYDGFVIGDAVLFGLEVHKVNIVGRPPCANWVEFHAKTGGYNVTTERDERTLNNPKPRKAYRFEVQGPNAAKILESVNGGPLPEIKFFNMGEITIAGRKVRCLRHGMAGAVGLEMWGPVAEGPEIRAALLKAGQEFGLRPAGARAYSTVSTESGWIASPLPAIYSGEKMKPYREWLKAEGFEANGSLGGSFVSNKVEDYYFTPWDLGYGHMIKFDHEFIGRTALERLAGTPHRRKVTLSWNSEDVTRVFSTQFSKDKRAKFMDMPASYYATWPYDAVQKNGKTIGVSTYPVYTANGREWISTAMVDDGVNLAGTELAVIWGEPDGGTARPTVERHMQMTIRVIVGPCPYALEAREAYRPHELQL